MDPESSNGCPVGESEESAAAYGLKAYTVRYKLFTFLMISECVL